jgi:hypothetical protein
MYRKSLTVVFLCIGLPLGLTGFVQAAPRPEIWTRWERNDPLSTVVVDHTPWRQFLGKYLVTGHPGGINRVRYGSVDPADKRNLEEYLNALQTVGVSGLNRREQMAYWINFYNALTVRVILDHYPVKSIRDVDISPGLFSNGPWDARLVTVEGEPVSLNDMEHRILRPIWQDNRVHYAVNCASLGCPNLQPEPYTSEKLESDLNRAAAEYVNHARGARMEGGRLILSSIYDWFQVDFGGSGEGVIQHIRKHAKDLLAEALKDYRGGISYEYDWSLNE